MFSRATLVCLLTGWLVICTEGLTTGKRSKYLRKCKQSDCVAGQECHTDGGHCVACRVGTYAPYDGLVECYACPAGTHGTANVSSPNACVACVPGRFAPHEGEPQCTACPPGQYQDVAGAEVCIDAVAAGDVVHEDCNDTHYLPSGAKTAEAALTPVKRVSNITVPWCEVTEQMETWEIVLLVGGIFVGCIGLAICCCACSKALSPL